MRVAVLIIGLCLAILLGVQSCTVTAGGGLAGNHDLSSVGVIGLLVSLLFILGSAFSIGAPSVSVVVFVIAALLGLIAGYGSGFKDMNIWAYVSSGLAIISYFGIAEKKKLEADRNPTKRCQFCAELVNKAAIVCKHCGRGFSEIPEVKAKVTRNEEKNCLGCSKYKVSFWSTFNGLRASKGKCATHKRDTAATCNCSEFSPKYTT